MQDRDGLFESQKKTNVEKKHSKSNTGSEGLKRVWRGKRGRKPIQKERRGVRRKIMGGKKLKA